MSAPQRTGRYAPRLPPQERREQVLDAALRLIVEHGYQGVSMQAVARQAGVAKPVVYDLYANAGELMRALLQREERRALATVATVIPMPQPGADPDELLVDALTAFLHIVSAHPDPWRLMLLPAEGTPRIVREHVDEGRGAIRAALEQLLEWGLAERGGPDDLDTELLARTAVALVEDAARLVLTDDARFPPERFREFVAGLLRNLSRP